MSEEAVILPLSRWQARLARSRRRLDVEELVAHPQAALLVPAMPVQDLFFVIKGVGLADCAELLALCHPRQVQGFLDLDAWRKDRLDSDRLRPWLEVLLAAPPERASELFAGLDPEIWVLLLQGQVRVYDHSPEQLDAFTDEEAILESPDRLYLVELLEPTSPNGQLVGTALEHLFRSDEPLRWRHLLESVRIEVPAEIEEAELRFRRARLEDLGFVDYHEAVSIFAYRDPEVARRAGPPAGPPPVAGLLADDDSARLPALFAGPLGDPSFLSEVMARISDDDRLDALAQQIIALANRLFVATDVDVGEAEAVAEAVARLRGTLSIALAHLGDADPDRALPHLLGRPLRDLFQIGFSATLALKRRAERLVRTGWLARPHARLDLLEHLDQEVLAGLRRAHPRFYAGLDDPKRVDHRDFLGPEDVARVRARLDAAERTGWLLCDRLGLDLATVPAETTLASVFRTAFVHLVLGNGFRFDPATRAEVARFRTEGMRPGPQGRRLDPEEVEGLTLLLDGRLREDPAQERAQARELAHGWLAVLEEQLGRLSPEDALDARFVEGLWLAARA